MDGHAGVVAFNLKAPDKDLFRLPPSTFLNGFTNLQQLFKPQAAQIDTHLKSFPHHFREMHLLEGPD